MDITTGAMASLMPKLGELLLEEYKLPKGVKQDIEYLSREMMSFRLALQKLGEVPLYQQEPGVRIWAVEVRELSYGLEDAVDSFLMGLEGSKPANLNDFKGNMKKLANMFNKGKTQRVFADVIKDKKGRVMEMAERRDRYRVHDLVADRAGATIDPRLMALYQNAEGIIGIEESSEDLIKKISCPDDYSSKRPLKILSIFGCMGLGKTTLAKVVYDQMKEKFSCRGFVAVGPRPDMKKTFRDLLSELGAGSHQDFSTLDERQLIDELRKLLHEKRYLIVVDDIWDSEAWRIIKIAFGDHAWGSSVIITTRNFAVAQTAGEVYKLKPLSHAKSEELFYKRLVGGKDKIPDELAEITKSVVKKCDCIPLAIITMASLLVGRPLQEWSEVYSIGFGHRDDSRDLDNTRNISLISYYDLPSHLRTCLVHLSIFPVGYMIRKDTLIWKWIAQGFLGEERGVGLFVLGQSYFNELINRSLVQPVEIPHSGIIIGCRVNVMVLDMICFLAREENFVTILDSHKQDRSDMHQARIIAIQNSVVEKRFVQENEMLANQHVRSFNVSKCEFQMMPSLASFKLVSVLALEDCASIGGIYHLEHIKELVLLRYLGLLNTPICELPEGIDKLEFLETLDLRQTKIEKLPHGIVLLRRLMCLRTGGRSITVPDGMGNLASLEELQLSDVAGSPNIVKELGKMKRLRDLKVCIRLSNERVERDLVYSLGDLQKIEILHLDGGQWIEESCWQGYVPSIYLRHVFLGMKFSRLPAWISPVLLPMLSHLSVDVSVVEEKDLVNLGRLPNLLSLSLVGDYDSLPDIMRGDAFPRLKYCYTSGMVRFLKGAAPDLESISFNVQMWGSKDGRFDLNFSSLLDHSQLQEVRVEIFYTEAHVGEVIAVEAALGYVVDRHLNKPSLAIRKWISSVSEQYGSHYDVDGNEYSDDYEIDSDHEYYDVEE